MTPRDEPDSALLERLLSEDGGEPPGLLASARDCLRFLEQIWPRPAVSKHAPIKLGRFEIIREVGRGGHGIVLLARDPDNDRDVALKLPRPEVLLSDSLRWRFEQEAQVAARLGHPNIVPIYEVGRTEATWYIASAYCPGPNLAMWLKEHGPAEPRQAAAIVKGLASAISHAHDAGLLHRDIKPANVLMTVGSEQWAVGSKDNSSLPTAHCPLPTVPMLTDFGLAKVLEPEIEGSTDVTVQQTQSGAMLGTIKYMAPEQVQGHRHRIGVATDIYALGAVLYELLCGAPPFDDRTPLAILTRIIGEDAGRPRSKRADIPLDLDSICLKCLEKEPSRRYRSAADLEADLAAFLAGEPVRARPISTPRRVARWARRRPAVSVAILAALTTIVTGLIGAGIHYFRLERLNDDLATALGRAEHQADELRWHAYVNDVRLAGQADAGQHRDLMRSLLLRHVPAAGERDLRGFEWHLLWDRTGVPLLASGPPNVAALAVTADGRYVLATAADGRTACWDLPTNQTVFDTRILPPGASGFLYSPDGVRIAAVESGEGRGALGVWNALNRKLISQRSDLPPLLAATAFDPSGRQLAYAASDGIGRPTRLHLWDLATGNDAMLWDRPVSVQTARFSADGRYLVWIDNAQGPREPATVVLNRYDLAERRELAPHALGNTVHPALALSGDGCRAAVGDLERNVRILDLDTGRLIASRELAVDESIEQIEFLAGDRFLAALARGRKDPNRARVLLLNAADCAILGEHRPADGTRRIAVSPDGRTIFAVGTGTVVELINVNRLRLETLPGHASAEAWSVAFTPDGRTLISGGDDHRVCRWDLGTRRELGPLDTHGSLVTAVACSRDGRHWASGSFDSEVRIWDAQSGKVMHVLAGDTERVRAVVFSPDGRLVASGGSDHSVILWDVATGGRVATLERHEKMINALAFTPEGRLLFSGGADERVHAWDVGQRDWSFTLENGSSVRAVAVSPDGRFLAAGSHRIAQVRVWDLRTRHVVRDLVTKKSEIRALAFSPDGRTLAGGGDGKMIQLWHVETGQELLAITGLSHDVNGLAFSPDGHTLAAALHDGTIKVWHAP